MEQAQQNRRAVLVVEDDAELRRLAARLLEDGELDTIDSQMLDRRAVELVLISLLAAFCGGLAWALDHELFAVAFAAAAVTGASGAVAALVNNGGS